MSGFVNEARRKMVSTHFYTLLREGDEKAVSFLAFLKKG
jgi:hypothetical protein